MYMPESTHALAAVPAPPKKFVESRKRFQAVDHIPTILLSGDGTIQHMTPSARRLLEYSSEKSPPSCFFSHVHARNMYQVMRDVADMVCYGKPKANWLLRLRTGRGRWQWVRAVVTNELNDPMRAIRVVLSDLSGM